MQVAADGIDNFPDGVWLVELATLRDPQLVPQAVASALGVKEAAGRPVLEALLKFLRNRHLLLILDNCEHLLQACAEARQAGPAGGRRFESARLEPRAAARGRRDDLSGPCPPGKRSGEPVHRSRERRESPASRRIANRAGDRKRLRRALDGIPLAIELAAARVRTLPLQKIAARLDDRFRPSRAEDQSALPRQQTLRALIDWSYELLTDDEPRRVQAPRRFFGRRLLPLEAAESGCARSAPSTRRTCSST